VCARTSVHINLVRVEMIFQKPFALTSSFPNKFAAFPTYICNHSDYKRAGIPRTACCFGYLDIPSCNIITGDGTKWYFTRFSNFFRRNLFRYNNVGRSFRFFYFLLYRHFRIIRHRCRGVVILFTFVELNIFRIVL